MARDPDQLIRMLLDSRAHTIALVSDLTDQQLIGPRLSIVNPMLWEIGHIAWFQERWVLRHATGAESILANADALYDSARVPHHDRWQIALPPRQSTLEYMQRVLDRVVERASSGSATEQDDYFLQLVLLHEDMHGEAFLYTRQTLGYPAPLRGGGSEPSPSTGSGASLCGDVAVPGGTFELGSRRDSGFVFDNEKWAHPVEIRPFRIARAPVTNREFAEFVADQGYARPEFWSPGGWGWRERFQVKQPVYWQRRGEGWCMRRYREMIPLHPHLPVMHVNWYEAEAYCRWARRRLPTEVEWELAAAGEPSHGTEPAISSQKRRYPWGAEPPHAERANLDCRALSCVAVNALELGDSAFGCRQMIGNVWEWTASDFVPYPGFRADPYVEYSQPWFGTTHRVLRGGAFSTRARLISNNFRNFYTPDRRDVFAGFRTCSLD